MDPKSANRSVGVVMAELAAGQYGVISTGQLRGLGLSKEQVQHRVRSGWLRRVHRGVYAVSHTQLSNHGLWLAAVLALGPTAVLSDRSATGLWRIWGWERVPPIHVTVPSYDGRCRRPGLIVHRRAAMLPDEVTTHLGIPVTSPARALLDISLSLPSRSLERAADEAERRKLCGADALQEMVRRHRGHRGTSRIRHLLLTHEVGSTPTRFALEEAFLNLVRKHNLPRPLINHPLLDYVLDAFWPEQRLIVELDGRESHGTAAAFQRDRDRDTRLQSHGFRTMRFTWFDVTRRPAVVADRVRRALRP
jgi:very-short-patch-repair endonuclease